MFRRRQVKTHGQLMRSELNEGFGHLRLAATHAADGAAVAIAPGARAAQRTANVARRAATGVAAPVVVVARKVRGGSRWSVPGRSSGPVVLITGLGRGGKAKSDGRRLARSAGRRWPLVLGGLLAAGAAAGAATTLLRRREDAEAWEAYDTRPETAAAEQSTLDAATTSMDAGVDTVSAETEQASERTSDLVGSRRHKRGQTGGA